MHAGAERVEARAGLSSTPPEDSCDDDVDADERRWVNHVAGPITSTPRHLTKVTALSSAVTLVLDL